MELFRQPPQSPQVSLLDSKHLIIVLKFGATVQPPHSLQVAFISPKHLILLLAFWATVLEIWAFVLGACAIFHQIISVLLLLPKSV